MEQKEKRQKRLIRHKRVRSKVIGTTSRPRFSVFRSARHIYAQLIDDSKGLTLLSVNDAKELKSKSEKKDKKAAAFEAGKKLAKKAAEKGIKAVAFDRGGYKYHGRVKALAEGAKEGGMKF